MEWWYVGLSKDAFEQLLALRLGWSGGEGRWVSHVVWTDWGSQLPIQGDGARLPWHPVSVLRPLTQLLSDHGIKGEPFLGKTMFSGAATKKREKGATEQLI